MSADCSSAPKVGTAMGLGMAKCIDAEGIPELEVGQFYFVQEIPNMLGHVVALRTGRPPVVGIDVERFELLKQEEV